MSTKIKPVINKDNCEGINYPSEKDDWKKVEKNNLMVALNILCAKIGKIYPAYSSKHDSKNESKLFF